MFEKLLFATSNPHKLKEVRQIFRNIFIIEGLDSIGFTEEIPETKDTIEENALQKVEYITSRTSLPVFAEDTGLIIKSLNGAPGVHSARYAGPGKSDQENVSKLLADLEGISDRRAYFLTVVAFHDHQGSPRIFKGRIDGTIGHHPKGDHGFGYDPVFIPDGYQETFAELDASIKNKISHRRKAFDRFYNFLKNP